MKIRLMKGRYARVRSGATYPLVSERVGSIRQWRLEGQVWDFVYDNGPHGNLVYGDESFEHPEVMVAVLG